MTEYPCSDNLRRPRGSPDGNVGVSLADTRCFPRSTFTSDLLQFLKLPLPSCLQFSLPLIFILPHDVHNRMCHCQVAIPLMICRHNIPWSFICAALR